MAARKPNAKTDPLKALMTRLLYELGELSSLRCPDCGSQTLRVEMMSHSGILVGCTGISDLTTAEGEFSCDFAKILRYEPRQADLTVVEYEGPKSEATNSADDEPHRG